MNKDNVPTLGLDVKNLYSVLGAAKYLGISRQTLWRWCKSGHIYYFQFDEHKFFHQSELDRKKYDSLRKSGRILHKAKSLKREKIVRRIKMKVSKFPAFSATVVFTVTGVIGISLYVHGYWFPLVFALIALSIGIICAFITLTKKGF